MHPPITNTDTAALGEVVSLARSLLRRGGKLESTQGGELIDQSSLSEALEQHLLKNMVDDSAGSAAVAKAAAAEGLARAESALRKTAENQSPASLNDLEVASLEAIIEVTGRPAMRYANGQVQMPEDLGDNGRWRVLIATAKSSINRASASVGRIMRKGAGGILENVGTGWRLGGDLIVTNRHVAQLLAEDEQATPPALKIDAAKTPAIDFVASDTSAGTKLFSLAGLVYCAEEDPVDLAILRITDGVQSLPESLTLEWDSTFLGKEVAGANGAGTAFKGNMVYVVGHPFRQRRSEAVAAVFGTADGSKRWSPGVVRTIDDAKPTFQHDCSTLGGNSGSCVFAAELHSVIGIHMGGIEMDKLTDRGRANLALALSRLDSHPAAKVLKDASA